MSLPTQLQDRIPSNEQIPQRSTWKLCLKALTMQLTCSELKIALLKLKKSERKFFLINNKFVK
jgi:hypothetical protein